MTRQTTKLGLGLGATYAGAKLARNHADTCSVPMTNSQLLAWATLRRSETIELNRESQDVWVSATSMGTGLPTQRSVLLRR